MAWKRGGMCLEVNLVRSLESKRGIVKARCKFAEGVHSPGCMEQRILVKKEKTERNGSCCIKKKTT
jgi:hypothetical protein